MLRSTGTLRVPLASVPATPSLMPFIAQTARRVEVVEVMSPAMVHPESSMETRDFSAN